MAIHAVPRLQSIPEAAVGMNCLFNGPAWSSIDDFVYTYGHLVAPHLNVLIIQPTRYTLLRPEQLPCYLGCQIKWTHTYDGPTLKLPFCLIPCAHPLPPAQLQSRIAMEQWLQRVLIRILSPPTPQAASGFVIFLPSTIRTFVHLLVHVKNLGYPAHWMSDMLEKILHDNLESEYRPASQLPIPVSDINRVQLRRKMQISPWMADIELVVGTALESLPFAVRLPPHFPAPASFCTFSARVCNIVGSCGSDQAGFPRAPSLAILFTMGYMRAHGYHIHPKTILFSDDTNAVSKQQIFMSIEKLDIDKTTNSGEITWTMDRTRITRMKSDGWSLCLWRTDTALIGTLLNALPFV